MVPPVTKPLASQPRAAGPRLMGRIGATRTRRMLGLSRREWLVDGGSAALFLAGALVLLALGSSMGSANWTVAAALVGIFALLSRVEYEIGQGYSTPTQLAFIPLLLVAPPRVVPLLVAAAYALASLFARGNRTRGIVLGISSSWFALGPAVVLSLLGAPGRALNTVAVLAAVLLSQILLDYGNWTLHESVKASHLRLAPLRDAAWLYGFDLILTPLGIGTAVLLRESLWALAMPLPILFLLRAVQTERRERFDHALELCVTYRNTAMLLGGIVEADDDYTGQHSLGVVHLAEAVALELGLAAEERRELEYAALLHDIGKIKVPKEILHKAGPLTDAEWVVMRAHAETGAAMLESVGGMLAEIAPVVRFHHERWDGGGYPSGLAAEAIPLHSRIIACCDTFSAITTGRPYRAAQPVADAMVEIERVCGSQLDPQVVAALARLVAGQQLRSAA